MKTKKRYLGLTTIANWAASIPAKAHFNLVISLMLLLAFAAPSIAQNAQGGKMVSPKVDRHAEALKFRRLMLQDEKGQIPADAWTRAAAQKKLMPFNAKAWPRNHGQNSPSSKQGGAIKPLVAGIESSGWTWLGPGNIGGRVRSILIHPTTPSTMWVGSVGGGVWKTVNGGTSWFPLDDFMANLAICCMVMDPQNPNLIYAGTGEGFGGDRIQGAGIFKTTDGGSTWVQLSSTANTNFLFVNRLAISPNNSQIVLAATRHGIFRSTDAGASWNQTSSSNTSRSNTLDLAFDPSDGSKCIASGIASGNGFVVVSTDGGMTWTAATGIDGAGRIEIAYAPSNPSIVYASVERNNGEVWRSTDGGQTYSLRNTGNNYFYESSGQQGWYDNCLSVDPTNPNTLVVGGIDLWRSTDGGSTLNDITSGAVGPGVHKDQHAIVFPANFNGSTVKDVFVGNDGGVFLTSDIYNVNGFHGPWTKLNNNLGITQFYGGAGNTKNGEIIGGAQDNAVCHYVPGSGWSQYQYGGDGFFCAADTNGNFYGEDAYLGLERNCCAGAMCGLCGIPDSNDSTKANFIAPFVLDPNNANAMVAGGTSLWRTFNVQTCDPNCPDWTVIKQPIGTLISAIAVAPGNSDKIWVGYNDGEVWSTANGLADSPAWTQNFTVSPGRICASIAIDPNNWDQVYVTFGGFSRSNVWRTPDAGTTWTNLSGNLPQAPVLSIVIDPHDSSYLYVGTEVGVFASSDGGASWSPSNDGPANVEVYQLFWMGDTLVAATHGRGMFAIQPIVWVDFNYNGTSQIGTYAAPFHTLAQGVNAVSSGSDIFIKTAGSSSEKMTISKPLTIHAYNGPDTIGH